MRIVNLLPLEDPDVKPALRLLASESDRILALKGQMLLDLIRYLEAGGAAPSAFAFIHQHEIWLSPCNQYNRARVNISVDWFDRGALYDGLPTMHYRLQFSRRIGGPTRDGRSSDLAEVKRLIWEGFGWGRASIDGLGP